MRGHRLKLVGIIALALASVTAVAGPIVQRVRAPVTMQSPVAPGRVVQLTENGLRTVHNLGPQARVIEGVISRASLRDPLVMHRSSLASLRVGANGRLVSEGRQFVPLVEKSYEYVLPVSGKNWMQSIKDLAPEIQGWMQTKTLAPASVLEVNGRWFIEAGGKSIPIRPPLIRRISHTGAI